MFATNQNRYFYKRLKIRSGNENVCCGWQSQFSKVWREFDTGLVNLDPPMMCADWPVPGNLTLLHTQTGYTLKPWHRVASARVRFPDQAASIIRCKNLALYIIDCVSLCLSEETLKALGPFYLVSMPGEVKDPTILHWKCVTCRGLHILA